MLKILFLFIAILATGHAFRCPYDGLFSNTESKHSYIRCVGGRHHVVSCAQGGEESNQWVKVFDGQQCVDPYECPEIDGTFKDTRFGRIYYRCSNDGGDDDTPTQNLCPDGFVFNGQRCVLIERRAESYVQPPAPSLPHYKLLIKERNLVKFEFNDLIVTDTFDEVAWMWNREIVAKK